ncbi:carbohydrate sulfotransferase 11-like isoform X2 [Diabrotica virgifera virgifera]|uniref:Carbohydrate sulfotransferase n=1 Tax=Diabrotica virgifera virgifera TaxID=50390 RepID=A0A6P7FWZ5_DIAVI|nr:carbohydrate sulfotransferase 11-like isoform X2 [Diabrotica virgifera virgifera]
MEEQGTENKVLSLDEEIENLSHEDLLEITQSSIRRLITSDPLLNDLPPDVTFEEVAAQIAVAQGQSITVTVNRYSESSLNVVVACTNWKRVMMVLTGESNTTNPIQISASAAHLDNSTLKLSQLNLMEVKECLRDYTLFLVARHPFERLLSAYQNKFLDNSPNNKYFKLRYGKHIIGKYRQHPSKEDLQTGANVTFREFIQYLIKEGVRTNEHWAPIYDLCLPCTLNYTFISHYETINDDSSTILRMVKAPNLLFPVTRSKRTKDNLRFYFQQLSIYEIEFLYKLYEADFKLFGYGLEDILGYDLA